MSIIEVAATAIYCAIGIIFVFPFACYAAVKLSCKHKAELLAALLVGAALASVWPLALLGMSASDSNV